MSLDIRAEIDACATGIKERISRARAAVIGRDAILTRPGKYHGRRGRIDCVFADEREGILLTLMIYKINSREFLNSDGDSRSCHSIHDLMLVD